MVDPTEDGLEALLRSGPIETLEGRAAAAAAGVAGRAAGAGLVDVAYRSVDSPLGELLVAVTNRGLVRVAYPEEPVGAVLDGLARRLSPRVLRAPEALDGVHRQLDEYFGGRRRVFHLDVDWTVVTGFGRAVLRGAVGIPFGEVRTYTELARVAGNPRAARATGNALGSNPIPIVVPCHRVVRTGGAMGGYTGGVHRKQRLLELEGWAPG